MNRNSFSPKSAQSGVALIEAMVAILLFSIGVLAVAGLQASMVRNTSDTKYRADASYVAQQMLGQMYSDLNGTLTQGKYRGITNVPSLPSGQMSIGQNAVNGPFTIVVGWTAPGDVVNPATAATCQPLNVAHCYKVSATVVPDCYAGDPGC